MLFRTYDKEGGGIPACRHDALPLKPATHLPLTGSCSLPSPSHPVPCRTYDKLITAGQGRDATERERAKGAAVATELRRVIAPFFLRREKRDVLRQQGSEDQQLQQEAAALGEYWGVGEGGRGGGARLRGSATAAGGRSTGGEWVEGEGELSNEAEERSCRTRPLPMLCSRGDSCLSV